MTFQVIEITQKFLISRHLKLITMVVICFCMVIIFQSQSSPGLSEKEKPEYEIVINETQITSDNGTQIYPKIFNNMIVWLDYRNDLDGKNLFGEDNTDIYAYDILEKKEIGINTNGSYVKRPNIYKDKIIWNCVKGYTSNIFLFNLSSNIAKQITFENKSWIGSIFQNNIAIERGHELIEKDIFLYNIEDEIEIPICTKNGSQLTPDIWGEWVIWSDARNGTFDIYGFNLKTKKEIQITNTTEIMETNPIIYNNNIIWSEHFWDPNGSDGKGIAYYNLSTNEYKFITSKSISAFMFKNYIIFYEYKTLMFLDITNNETYILSNVSYNLNDIWENKLACEKDGDIYLLEFELHPATANGKGSDGGGKSVWERYGFSILAIIILLVIIISYILYRKKSKTK
jgi:beta propeller repeat protein